MLEVNNLSRSYGAFKAVDSVSFNIKQGEIVGLLGHNGAGKTTIMKMLSGYLEPDQGDIKVNHIDMAEDAMAIQRNLGYLPESLPIYPEMLVADYLDYAAQLKQIGQNKDSEIRRVVEATEIADKMLSPIANLSRGYKQRVGVAQALLGNPQFLILDEPTNGLDPTQTEHMRQLIKSISQHATVILSTHIMQEVDAICDRVLILRGGKLVVDSRLDELHKANYLKISTSMSHAALAAILQPILGASDLQTDQTRMKAGDQLDCNRYRISVDEQFPVGAQANIAKAVITAGESLYQLSLEHRDLETLFRDVNNQSMASQVEEMLTHAA